MVIVVGANPEWKAIVTLRPGLESMITTPPVALVGTMVDSKVILADCGRSEVTTKPLPNSGRCVVDSEELQSVLLVRARHVGAWWERPREFRWWESMFNTRFDNVAVCTVVVPEVVEVLV